MNEKKSNLKIQFNSIKENPHDPTLLEALMVVHDTKDCCQRDLARVLLKDRANTGKLAKSLEEKGLVKIKATIKNNRAVKNINKITNNFKDVEYIKIPEVYPEYCSSKLITMELIDGYFSSFQIRFQESYAPVMGKKSFVAVFTRPRTFVI